jgi:hypothetical protein
MAYNILEARRQGYNDKEIADFLAEHQKVNLDTARKEGYSDSEIISFLNKQDFSFGEAFMAGVRAERLSEIDGIKQILGGELDEDLVAKENLAQQAYEERGVATTLGRIAGGLINPSTLLPGSMLFKGWKGASAAGALGGGIGGAVRPLYEEDDSRLASGIVGVGAGAVIGGTLGKLVDTLAKRSDVNKAAVDAPQGNLSSAEKTLEDDLETEAIVKSVIGDEDPLKSVNSNFIQQVDNELSLDNLPVLPPYLSGSSPRFLGTKLNWESDIDLAFYTVGKGDTKSKSHKEFVDYLSSAFNISEADVLTLSKSARTDIIDNIKTQQKEAAKLGAKTETVTVPVSKTLESLVNPVTKGLDDLSKVVYNIGGKFQPDAAGRVRINPTDPAVKELETVMKTLDPNYNIQDAVLASKGYNDILNKLKESQGRNYTSKTFSQFIKDKPYNVDVYLEMAKRGDYNGCL